MAGEKRKVGERLEDILKGVRGFGMHEYLSGKGDEGKVGRNMLYRVRKKQGAGFYQADVGEKE